MQLNLYSSVPATQSFIHPMSAKNSKNMGLKLNLPQNPGLNPSGSSKNIQEGSNLFSSPPSPLLINQNS